jgi:vesicle coat complex subunit
MGAHIRQSWPFARRSVCSATQLQTGRARAGVLAELKEYAQEVDVDFVRKAVACIGQVALRLESTAQKCVEALLELLKLKVAYVVQEAVVVIKARDSLCLLNHVPFATFAQHVWCRARVAAH